VRKIVSEADGTYRVIVTRKGVAPRSARYADVEAALAWAAEAEAALRRSTLRFGGQAIIVTGAFCLRDYLLSCGILGVEDGGSGEDLTLRLADLLADDLLGLPLAAIDGETLAALRARRRRGHPLPAVLWEQAMLAAAFARMVRRELSGLEMPYAQPAPDGIRVLAPDDWTSLLRAANRSFHPAFALVLRLAFAVAAPLPAICALTWDDLDLRARTLRLGGSLERFAPELADAIEKHVQTSHGLLFPEATEARVASGLAALGRRKEWGKLAPEALLLTAWQERLLEGAHPESFRRPGSARL
jgi:integrase